MAATLALVNPLLTTVWTRALAESIVAAFSLLALALALAVMPYVATLGRPDATDRVADLVESTAREGARG